jgi:hypothetical protein
MNNIIADAVSQSPIRFGAVEDITMVIELLKVASKYLLVI